MNTRVLCVDDDPNVLAAHQRNLRKQFDVEVASGAAEAIELVKNQGPFAVILADMRMPGVNGVELLVEVNKLAPETVRLMLTGNADQQTAIDAVNKGHVFRFLTKPCSAETLADALRAGTKQYRLVTAERELLEKTLNGAVKALTEVLGILAPGAFHQGEQLRDLVRAYASHFNLKQSWTLEMAAMLSRVGYVAIPPSVLLKTASRLALRPEEKDMIARVPRSGADLLANIPRLEEVSHIVLYQTKNFDGSGFPCDSVSGEDLPIGARVIRVLSDLIELEAGGSSRSQVISHMRTREGCYDPRVLDSVSVCFDIALPERPVEAGKVLDLPLRELRPGQKLARPIVTTDGNLLMPSGSCLTPMALVKLRNFAQLHSLSESFFVFE